MIKILRKLLKFKKAILLRILYLSLFIIVILIIKFRDVIYLKYYSYFYISQDFIFNEFRRKASNNLNINQEIFFKSNCKCWINQTIGFKSIKNNDDIQFRITNYETKFEYKINKKVLQDSIFTCNLYNVFRRGPSIKVISFALYGKNNHYYNYLKKLIKFIYLNYPKWLIRIYYDSTIDQSIICELECYKNEQENSFYDIVDLCDIENLPTDLNNNKWNASFMHGMSWRWLPLGDSFVDYFSSRDSDAWMSKREVDSVNVWLKSNTLFHVMRDHPHHDVPILGGGWGFANVLNRNLAKYFFKIITNRFIANYYNKIKHEKGKDQYLLSDYFSYYSFKNSTTHDSYSCMIFGGDPWPSKRENFCFFGCSYCCEQKINETKTYPYICPQKCRPKNHQDWIYC